MFRLPKNELITREMLQDSTLLREHIEKRVAEIYGVRRGLFTFDLTVSVPSVIQEGDDAATDDEPA